MNPSVLFSPLYRPCVGMMIFNSRGLVWVGRRRVDSLLNSSENLLWQMPQGGIDPGEEPLDAAWREIYEETGMKSLELLAEAPFWVHYDLPSYLSKNLWQGKYKGQIQKWFAFCFHGDESEISVSAPPAGNRIEFDDWAWRPMKELPDLIVPFKRIVYLQVLQAFSYLEKPFLERNLQNKP